MTKSSWFQTLSKCCFVEHGHTIPIYNPLVAQLVYMALAIPRSWILIIGSAHTHKMYGLNAL